MAVEQKLITRDAFEAFLAQPDIDERLFELINGEIIEKVPTQLHGRIVAFIVGMLFKYFELHPIGFVEVEVRHGIPKDAHNDVIPDISVTLDTTTPPVAQGAVPHMPDIAIEVQSPTDSLKKLRAQADYYLANGTRMVWLVLPEEQVVEVRTADAEAILTIKHTLDGGDVLPGFTLAVKSIFPETAQGG
jgi:Uma2 family endonuclease